MRYCSAAFAYSMQEDLQEVVSIQYPYKLCKCQKLPFQLLVESRADVAAAKLCALFLSGTVVCVHAFEVQMQATYLKLGSAVESPLLALVHAH